MTLRTGEDILIWMRRLWIALCGGIVLEEALDLSSDRILNEWMNELCIKDCCLQSHRAYWHFEATSVYQTNQHDIIQDHGLQRHCCEKVKNNICNFLCLVNEQAIYICPQLSHVCQPRCLYICKPWSITATSNGEVLWLLPVCNFTVQCSELKSRSDVCYILAPGLGFLTHAEGLEILVGL